MSLCFCSLIRSSPLIYDSNFPWNLNLNRSTYPISFSVHGNSRNLVARVVQHGLEVNNISLPSPTIEAEEEKEVIRELGTGAAGAELVEHEPKPVRVRKKRAGDDDNDDESFEDRFKLRNGKEVIFFFWIYQFKFWGKTWKFFKLFILKVFEEKAYLVGVERKGETLDSFGIEESLKELAQLADTAGLMVVGSTYQK